VVDVRLEDAASADLVTVERVRPGSVIAAAGGGFFGRAMTAEYGMTVGGLSSVLRSTTGQPPI
jgi:hypothetical protein